VVSNNSRPNRRTVRPIDVSKSLATIAVNASVLIDVTSLVFAEFWVVVEELVIDAGVDLFERAVRAIVVFLRLRHACRR
jgi:hypothetical protein